MGFAKYKEDNERIITERLYDDDQTNMPNEHIKLNIRCYYCNKLFECSNERNKHIKLEHNFDSALLIVNGKISSSEYYTENIISGKIILSKINNDKILINNEEIRKNDEEIDIIGYLNNNINENVICIGEKKYILKKYTIESISNFEIEKIIDGWEKQISIENNRQLSNTIPKNINDIETKYLNGFYDYYSACRNSISIENKKNRYESALAILSNFNKPTPKSIVVLKVIAFKFNWIEKFEQISRETSTSTFNYIVDFYNGNSTKENLNKNEYNGEKKIYVEDEILEIMNIIHAFQNEEWKKVDNYINYWNDEKINSIVDVNKRDRILYLKARRLNKLEKYFEEKKCYELIKTPSLLKKNKK
jgi:hypothetical protein